MQRQLLLTSAVLLLVQLLGLQMVCQQTVAWLLGLQVEVHWHQLRLHVLGQLMGVVLLPMLELWQRLGLQWQPVVP